MPDLKNATLSVLSKLLNWVGEKPRHRLFCLLNDLYGIVKVFFVAFRAFQIRNYFKLHLFAFLYALIGLPILITAFPHFPPIFHQSLAILAIFVPVFSSEIFWESVADKNPNAYLKTLRLKLWVLNIFWVLLFAFILSLSFLALSVYFPNIVNLLLSLGVFVIIVELIVGISLLEASLSGLELPSIFIKESRQVLLRTDAKAYFSVIGNGNNLEKDISNFKSGIDYVNIYLKTKFKLGLLKRQDYCNFFKLLAFSRNEEEKDRIRDALRDFANSLKCEMDLTDILMATRNIIEEPVISFEDAAEELEFDVGIRKTISKNKELITFLVAFAVFILTAVQVIPLVWNALHPVSNPAVAKTVSILFGAV